MHQCFHVNRHTGNPVTGDHSLAESRGAVQMTEIQILILGELEKSWITQQKANDKD